MAGAERPVRILPTEIRVGPYTYTVDESVLGALKAKVEERNGGNVGRTDHRLLAITIDPDQAPDSKADTLLHEVLHAVWFASALHESPAAKHEELVVTALATSVLDVLRRNPDLVKALAG